MHPVRAHFDHREKRPRPRLREMLGESEAPVGHLVDLACQVVLVVGPEVLRVEDARPTTSAISSRKAAEYVYLLSSDGVRKQLTMTPLSGRGGYVPGTLRTADEPPRRASEIPGRGSQIASLIAMKPPSYVWSDLLQEAVHPEVADS